MSSLPFKAASAFTLLKGITQPTDLAGKTVGLPEYQMIACLWLRGIFQYEYGVHTNRIVWRGGGQETPGREEKLKFQLPPDIDYRPIPDDKTLSEEVRHPSTACMLVKQALGKTTATKWLTVFIFRHLTGK